MYHPPYAGPRPRLSSSAVGALILGVLAVLSTPLFGLFLIVPAAAAITGALALRFTHTEGLRGRGLALWGFWLGASFFLFDFLLLLLGIWGMKLEG
ncbi:hypothetical protein [Nocardiopsis suaedae]|uniref:DUF4190 domain-containing protein n=1 Tax=Nocardiopsis suaedae TaxID=3018444 RepID=A0ABT4TUW3_9ACTN|nr:hypothetical protein [Nocardiopsis suaedae]MDA2807995.1 hypothetical protein [Nocardiopsis suaedae]